MRLVYAVVDNPNRMTIQIVLEAPAKWWREYGKGTGVGVYDTNNPEHLKNLAFLLLGLTNDAELNSRPSRESSI